MNEPPTAEVVRWYTRARKFPQLIGRTPDGRRIPGGPYTFTQAVGAGVVLLVGVNTMGWWARYGLIGNGLLLLAVAYGMVLGLGRIPVGSRSPLAVASGGVRALTAPRVGRLAGRPVRLRRPHQVRHRLMILADPPRILPGRPAQPGILPVTAAAAAAGGTARYTPPDVVGRNPAKVGKVSVATPAVPAGDAGTTPPSRWRTRAGRPPRAAGRAGLTHRRRIRGLVANHPATAVDVPAQPQARPGKETAAAARAAETARRVRAALPAEWGGQGSAPAGGPAEASRGPAAPPSLSGVQLLLARAGGPEAGI